MELLGHRVCISIIVGSNSYAKGVLTIYTPTSSTFYTTLGQFLFFELHLHDKCYSLIFLIFILMKGETFLIYLLASHLGISVVILFKLQDINSLGLSMFSCGGNSLLMICIANNPSLSLFVFISCYMGIQLSKCT